MYTYSANLFDAWVEKGINYNEYPLIVSNCGFQKFLTKNYTVSRPAGRIDYQLLYVVNGMGYFTIFGKEYEVEPGNIVLYLPNTPQHYTYKFEDETEVYWIHFSGYAADEHLKKMGIPGNTVTHVGISTDFIELLKKIILELHLKNPMYDYLISGYLLELFSLFAKKIIYLKSNTNPRSDSALNDVISLMHSKYNMRNSVEYYANACNLSLYRFNHKFKKMTGMSPVEYITNIRVNEAKNLLLNSSLNISEISSVVGYENPLYFSRVFKKATGISPSAYKHLNKNL